MCVPTLSSDPALLHFSRNCLPNEEEIKKITYQHIFQQTIKRNIADRLPENSRNRFVDRQSKKNSKKDRPNTFVFSLKADLLYFD